MHVDSGIAGKIAIVTGGSRGIGRAIVELLAAEGADVTFFYRDNAAAADEVVAAGRANGATISAERVDVRDSSACAAAVERVAPDGVLPTDRAHVPGRRILDRRARWLRTYGRDTQQECRTRQQRHAASHPIAP